MHILVLKILHKMIWCKNFFFFSSSYFKLVRPIFGIWALKKNDGDWAMIWSENLA